MRAVCRIVVLTTVCAVLMSCCSPEGLAGGKGKKKKKRAAQTETSQQTTLHDQSTAAGRILSMKDVRDALQLPCPEVKMTAPQPLPELLKTIDDHWKAQGVHIPIFPDSAELALENITSLNEIAVPETNLAAGAHTCETALKLFLRGTNDPELWYLVGPGYLQISTRAKVESDESHTTEVYDISGLAVQVPAMKPVPAEPTLQSPAAGQSDASPTTSGPASQSGGAETSTEVLKQFGGGMGGFGGGGMGGVPVSPTETYQEDGYEPILTLIQQQTSPEAKWYHIDGEGGQLSLVGQYLFVRQTQTGQEAVRDLLEMLRQSIREGGPPRASAASPPPVWGHMPYVPATPGTTAGASGPAQQGQPGVGFF
ncbi:MAG: hypothetical protein R3C49_00735 [Planctomycetaceae bacterium]